MPVVCGHKVAFPVQLSGTRRHLLRPAFGFQLALDSGATGQDVAENAKVVRHQAAALPQDAGNQQGQIRGARRAAQKDALVLAPMGLRGVVETFGH